MKKPILFSLLICFIFSIHSIWAQQNDSLVSKASWNLRYQTETIHLRFATYVKNDSVYNIGIVGEVLKHEMVISPEAMEVYKKYQKQKRWTLVLKKASHQGSKQWRASIKFVIFWPARAFRIQKPESSISQSTSIAMTPKSSMPLEKL
jgi:hypothetical protein